MRRSTVNEATHRKSNSAKAAKYRDAATMFPELLGSSFFALCFALERLESLDGG